MAHIADGRSREVLYSYFAQFEEAERESVESVAMDMWAAYIRSVEDNIPGAQRKTALPKLASLAALQAPAHAAMRQPGEKRPDWHPACEVVAVTHTNLPVSKTSGGSLRGWSRSASIEERRSWRAAKGGEEGWSARHEHEAPARRSPRLRLPLSATADRDALPHLRRHPAQPTVTHPKLRRGTNRSRAR